MLTGIALEEAASSRGSIWVPMLVLGWFVVMTIVGWRVSRRTGTAGSNPPAGDPAHPESNPSEFDTH